MLSWDVIQAGLERFVELLRADGAAWSELAQSRQEFFVDARGASAPGAEQRHLEWFLLERHSAALGGIPFQVLEGRWSGALGTVAEELTSALAGSLAGAFEVTSIVPADGLWVRDLLTLGEHPVLESEAGSELEVGDLLVGRLFPVGAGTHVLSRGLWSLRNPDVVEAVRSDLGALRAAQRGARRVSQFDLERLFHAAVVAQPELIDGGSVRRLARTALEALGLPRVIQDSLLQEVERGARSGDGTTVTECLNRLAFETEVDLDSAREVLTTLWESARSSSGSAAVAAPSGERGTLDPRAALEAFDRGRQEGQDLELLFQTLERDLGLESEDQDQEGEDEGAPDFPGVVGAIVEEFLWETRRELGEERAEAWSVLRQLGLYGRDIGVFEDLGAAKLLDFSARWLLDESGLQSAEEARTLLEALEAFCRWCEEQHDLNLWTQFGPTLEALRGSVPRLLVLRQGVPRPSGAGSYEVLRVSSQEAWVRDEKGEEQSVSVTAAQAENLRAGDLVRLVRKRGTLALGAGYPAQVAELLRR